MGALINIAKLRPEFLSKVRMFTNIAILMTCMGALTNIAILKTCMGALTNVAKLRPEFFSKEILQ